MNSTVSLSVIVPVYNSADIINELCYRLVPVLENIVEENYEIILVDDCSRDEVWDKIKSLSRNNRHIKGYRLGRNYGHWMASLAGIERSLGEYVVTMDDDLEYDPLDIKRLYQSIISHDYYLVFGIAAQRYKSKNGNYFSASLRNQLINFLWQKFITDSYKIFHRDLLFRNEIFSPRIHFEAFIKHTLDEKFVGYEEVSHNKRFSGKSNHTLWKKIRSFMHFSIEYYSAPVTAIALMTAVFFTSSGILEYFLFRGKLNGLLNTAIGLTGLGISFVALQYVVHIYRSLKNIPDYWIVENTLDRL